MTSNIADYSLITTHTAICYTAVIDCAYMLSFLQMLLQPLGTSYQTLAQECVKHGVGVELFLFPTDYCDLATLGNFVSTTGGEIHYYTNFQVCMMHTSLSPI